MKTVRDQRLGIRLAGPLLSELELAAAEHRRSLSDHVRQVLADYASERLIRREQLEAA